MNIMAETTDLSKRLSRNASHSVSLLAMHPFRKSHREDSRYPHGNPTTAHALSTQWRCSWMVQALHTVLSWQGEFRRLGCRTESWEQMVSSGEIFRRLLRVVVKFLLPQLSRPHT